MKANCAGVLCMQRQTKAVVPCIARDVSCFSRSIHCPSQLLRMQPSSGISHQIQARHRGTQRHQHITVAAAVQDTAEQSSQGPQSHLKFTGQETPQEILDMLQRAAALGVPLSPESASQLQSTVNPTMLSNLSHTQLAFIIKACADVLYQPQPEWISSVLSHVSNRINSQLTEDSMSDLAALLWAVAELPGCQPDAVWFQTAQARLLSGIEAGSFFASDYCMCLSALSALGYKPDEQTKAALANEAQYQLKEFIGDFGPKDVARLATAVADLGLLAALPADFQDRLLKAVYSKVRTIEDKAACDFALAKLGSEEKSMHYDPRWTHEELRWLPRSERDKRRIISENWQRTQWAGW